MQPGSTLLTRLPRLVSTVTGLDGQLPVAMKYYIQSMAPLLIVRWEDFKVLGCHFSEGRCFSKS